MILNPRIQISIIYTHYTISD